MDFHPTKNEDTLEQTAYANANKILNARNDVDRITGYYDKWAEGNDYDNQIFPGYGAPQVCFEVLSRYIADQTESRIIDIGAGTGMSAQLFKNHGFTNIDALDPSDGMLKKAQEKRMYRNYYTCFFTENTDCLETDAYDAMISCGAFGGSQVQSSALSEVVRCIRSGGYACIVTRTGYVDASTEMGQEMMRLEEEGQWRRLSETPVPNYLYKFPGVAVLFQITKPASQN